jgi:PAS domain S-box-containing protein
LKNRNISAQRGKRLPEEFHGLRKGVSSKRFEGEINEDRFLRESEAKYRSLVSHIPDVIWTTDRDRRVVFISKNVESITGYTPDEEYESSKYGSWFDRAHPEDLERIKSVYANLVENKEPYNVEYRFRRRDGKWIWVHDRAVATYEKNGNRYADGLLSDITERKQSEEETRRLKEKYESVIKNIPDTIYSGLPDDSCTMTFISDRYRDWTGYSPGDFYHDSWAWPKTVHPEDRERELKTYVESCRKKQPYLSEYRIVHKDTGEIRWVRDHGVPVTDKNGDLVLFDGTITDITERKQAEAEIKRLKDKYESLIRNIPITIYSSLPDETSTTIFISDRYKEWTGYSPEDFYHDRYTWYKSLHPGDRASAIESYIKAYKNNNEYNYEYRVIHKDTGEVRWVREHGVPVKDEDGTLVLFDGTITDITERKLAEEAQQKSEEFSTNLLKKSPNPIVVINSDLSVKYVNPALEKMTGFSSKELLGKKPPYPWFTGEDGGEEVDKLQLTLNGDIAKSEQLYQKKDGERFWVEVTSATVTHSDGSRYLLVNWTNVTEQKRLRDDMRFYIREVTRAQENERNRISRELHDETAQSLADLCTDVDTIVMKEQLPLKVVQRLEKVRLKIDNILEEVRRFSHELRPGLLDQFGLIPSLENLVADVNTEKNLICCLEVEGVEQRLSSEAESLLFRITQEALRNIRKHARATEAIVRVNFRRGKVVLRITDNGVGFKVPEMMSGFTRGGKLGLMGMQERAHLLDGSLKVDSRIGRGTSIEVNIPVKPDNDSCS